MAGPCALYDRVYETSTTTSTGTYTLLGAVTGFQSFAAVGNSNTCYYCAVDRAGGGWEVGIGTYTVSGTTLARTTILASSNSGSAVSWSAGTRDVFLTLPAVVAQNALFTGTAAVTVGNTGTETTLLGAGNGSLTIPANFLRVGKTLRLKLRGYWSNATVSPGNMTFNFKLGGTTIITTSAFALVGTLTNTAWEIEVEVVCLTAGSSGTIFAQGRFLAMAASLATTMVGMVATASTTINTTTTQALDLTATWSSANASNTITQTNATLEGVG